MTTVTTNIALERFTTFGDLLRYLRRRAGYTQRELSIAVGYSDTQISRLEHNERLPDLATLTARFLPILQLDKEPEVASRLLELAAAVRREDAPAAGLPPYKGLRYFDEGDADLFFGRKTLTEHLLARLARQAESEVRFLAIVGASGSGKSSVVRAGLIPALRWQPATSGWPIFVLSPGAHPLESLAACLRGETGSALPARKLADELAGQPDRLGRALQELAGPAATGHSLLILDQFEELFTLCRTESEQAAFVDNLTAAASQPGQSAAVVIVLRADFYAHCARFYHLRSFLAYYQEYIGAMTAGELRLAIEEPARQEHWQLEPGLVELLLHEVGADAGYSPEPGALPLLSHALLATWQRRRGRTMTLSGYAASGGVRGAIAETAESVFYDQLDREQRQIARQIFLRLTELGGGDNQADTRRRASIDELLPRPEDRELVHQVLSALADARLVTTDQNAAEVAHEALIREWPTLRRWLEEDREGLRLHRRLTEAALEWQALGRDPGGLYRGARLVQAAEWTASQPDDLNALEREFLDASQALVESEARQQEAQRQSALEAARRLAEAERARAEEQQQANRRLSQRAAWLAVALVVAALLAVTAALFAGRTSRAERLATSRELAAAAVANLQVDAERSALLALQALDLDDNLEARNALHQVLPELHLRRTLEADVGGVPDVVFSPDGAHLASLGELAEVKIWETATGREVMTLHDDSFVYGASLAFSPDGRLLAVSGVTTIVIWDAASGEKVLALQGKSVGASVGYNLGTGQISFSPDGARLAVANMDGYSKVWDLASGAELLALPPLDLPAKAIAYSPDGRWLATAGDEGIVTQWDAADGRELRRLELSGIIHAVAFSRDSSQLAAASEDGNATIWDASSGQQLLSLPPAAGMYDLAFLAGGRLATAGQDGVTRVYNGDTGQLELSLTSGASTVIGVAGSPDGSLIATSSYDGRVRLWDAGPGHELLTLSGHQAIVWNVAYSPDGQWMASAGVDGVVNIWDAGSGQLLHALSAGYGGPPGYTSLAVSPDGKQLAAGGLDGSIVVWDTGRWQITANLSGQSNMVVGLDFSAGGRRLASGSWDGTAIVWDLENLVAVTTFSGHGGGGISNVAFSPDAKSVFSGSDDNFARQWDAATGLEIQAFSTGAKEVYSLDVSPDGQTLATGDQDGRIILWEIASGRQLRTLNGHAGLLLRLTFSQDGAWLASASFDRLAKVWDVASGQELQTLYGNLSNVFGVAFSPDSSQLVTAGGDGTVRTYTLSLDQLVTLAQERLTRGLTDEECRKFLHAEACP
jgi:WD40 repeat protein/transcriptional regulator with XRE-family HTH domain